MNDRNFFDNSTGRDVNSKEINDTIRNHENVLTSPSEIKTLSIQEYRTLLNASVDLIRGNEMISKLKTQLKEKDVTMKEQQQKFNSKIKEQRKNSMLQLKTKKKISML